VELLNKQKKKSYETHGLFFFSFQDRQKEQKIFFSADSLRQAYFIIWQMVYYSWVAQKESWNFVPIFGNQRLRQPNHLFEVMISLNLLLD
jgi:hypothetical protein